MRQFLFQVKINYQRIVFRNLRFLLFSVAMPVCFYLLFTQLMTQGMSSQMLATWNVDYLISMIVYSSLLGSIFTVSNTLLEDHDRHFDLLITLTPISKMRYYVSMLIVFLSLTMLSTGVLEIVALVVNHVSIDRGFLLAGLVLVPILSLPMLFIGVMLSLAGSSNVVGLLSNLIVFPMAIVSGLWWPLNMMPNWMQTIGKGLPTYHLAQLLKTLLHQGTLSGVAILWLAGWSFILGMILKLIVVYREKSEVQTI